MKTSLSIFLLVLAVSLVQAAPAKREYYEIRIYTISNAEQEKQLDSYLKNAYLPAIHRAGIAHVGVFKPVESDTVYFGKRVYVLTPFKSLEQVASLQQVLAKDAAYVSAGKEYTDAPYTTPPYDRMESVVLQAFAFMPVHEVPKPAGQRSQRVYELRSYEGHTEKIYRNKVHMFNEGGEIALFRRLNFNAVFYGEVLIGSRMPNLMYMTTFEDRASRDEHWKTFGADAEWKKLSSMPEYQHNVSKITIYLLYPTDYSDL